MNATLATALRYKGALATLTEVQMKQLDRAYAETHRAKSGHSKTVNTSFTFMARKAGGAGVQMPSAVCTAAAAETLYWSLNSANPNCKKTTAAIWESWMQRPDDDEDTMEKFPRYFVEGIRALERSGLKLHCKSDARIDKWTLQQLIQRTLRDEPALRNGAMRIL